MDNWSSGLEKGPSRQWTFGVQDQEKGEVIGQVTITMYHQEPKTQEREDPANKSDRKLRSGENRDEKKRLHLKPKGEK